MKTRKVYQTLAQLVCARLNCIKSDNKEWFVRHTENIESIVKNQLPSGSGIDCGTKIDLDASTPEKLVLNVSFHHMDDAGGYDGWTEHCVIVTPSLSFDFHLKITGKDRNGIKEYLADVYNADLDNECQPYDKEEIASTPVNP